MGRGRGRRCDDEEKRLAQLLQVSYNYLYKNFSKFDQKTKVYIAIELIKRRVPQNVAVSGDVSFNVSVVEPLFNDEEKSKMIEFFTSKQKTFIVDAQISDVDTLTHSGGNGKPTTDNGSTQ